MTWISWKQNARLLRALDGLKIFNANAATLLRSMEMGCAGYFQELWQSFHPDLYVWLCKNYKEQPEKAQELMNFLGAASMVECQVYPVNSKYPYEPGWRADDTSVKKTGL